MVEPHRLGDNDSEQVSLGKKMHWFYCTTHNLSHQGTHCDVGTRNSCTDVGPFAEKRDADLWSSFWEVSPKPEVVPE